MSIGINGAKTDELRGVIFRKVVELFIGVLEHGENLGLLLAVDVERRRDCVDRFRKRFYAVSDEEFVLAVMVESSEFFIVENKNALVRDYLGLADGEEEVE